MNFSVQLRIAHAGPLQTLCACLHDLFRLEWLEIPGFFTTEPSSLVVTITDAAGKVTDRKEVIGIPIADIDETSVFEAQSLGFQFRIGRNVSEEEPIRRVFRYSISVLGRLNETSVHALIGLAVHMAKVVSDSLNTEVRVILDGELEYAKYSGGREILRDERGRKKLEGFLLRSR